MSITTALVIAAASWSVLACIGAPGCAWMVGRIRRRARTYTDFTLWKPDVPKPEPTRPLPPVIELPADASPAELERAVYDALFVEIMWPEFPYDRKNFAA